MLTSYLHRSRVTTWLTALFLSFAVLLSGCGGGGASTDINTQNMLVTPDSAVAYNGIPVTFHITGGMKAYHVTSSNSSVISLPYDVPGDSFVVNPSNVEADTDVTLTVMDATGYSQKLLVTVKPAPLNNAFTITPVSATCGTAVCSGQQATASVTMKIGTDIQVGKKVQFDVIDYSAFSFISDTGALTKIIEATTDQTGKAIVRLVANSGVPTQFALIRATDVSGGSYVQTTFTIVQFTNGTAVLSVVPPKHTITAYWKGTCSSGVKVDYLIHGGTPPYTVQSTSTGVATVSPTTVLKDGAGFTATTQNGFCPGEVTIDIKDATGLVIAATLENKEGAETVPVPDPIAFFTTAPAAVSVVAGGPTATFVVGGGTPSYYASSSDTSVALAFYTGSLVITGVASGTATITVMDSAGASKSITVTVTGGPGTATGTALSLSSSAVTLSPAITSVNVLVSGGRAPYSVYSNASAIVAASISGNTITITRLAPGTATITVVDAAGSATSLTVTSLSSTPGALTASSTTIALSASTPSVPVYVVGGLSPYSVVNSAPSIVTATNSGNTITITRLAPGTATVTVIDALGASVGISVTSY
ncbi:MAG: hypothetical protein Q8O37_07380 [Sulfuricellaceae bacterium]|nr:hypothetical protein [Sulfuricellaceae bacterium]